MHSSSPQAMNMDSNCLPNYLPFPIFVQIIQARKKKLPSLNSPHSKKGPISSHKNSKRFPFKPHNISIQAPSFIHQLIPLYNFNNSQRRTFGGKISFIDIKN
ncbi:hypothetical protein [Cryptosporidium hominis TU502]|uniref:hypothetical protein n=1 Tax=Cryptosporidium hominis (strain TU502) TaxID=353151 RepID=UPI0000452E77|nr:hypothetical protein [Cryptosporidium hominis TU502]